MCADAVAGLISTTDAFLHQLPKALLHSSVSKQDMAMVRALSAMIPALPVVENTSSGTAVAAGSDGNSVHSKWHLLPAEYWSRNGNDENTEL